MKKILLFLFLVVFAAPSFADLKVAVGSYTGNATDNRTIDISDTTDPSIADFQPKAVFIKCDNTSSAAWSSSAMSADTSYRPTLSTTGTADLIQSFVSNGFTIGANAIVNDNGVTCWYLALAGTDVSVGTYTGDGTDNRSIITSPAFQPIFVAVQRSFGSSSAMWANFTGTDNSCYFNADICAVDRIDQFNADGFRVDESVSASVNTDTLVMYYLTVKSVSGQSAVGSFTGTGTSQNITTVGFQPDFVLLRADSATSAACSRFEPQSGDDSSLWTGSASVTGAITAILSNGFSVNDHACANENTKTIYYLALKSESQTSFVAPQIIIVE